ncbi:hypothetical protein D3C81_2054120 [compost metagenome]
MKGMYIVIAWIGYPAVVIAVIVHIRGVEFIHFVVGVNVAQLDVVPQGIGPRGKVGFIRGIHISGIEVHHNAVLRIGLLPIPCHRETVTGAIGLIDPLP